MVLPERSGRYLAKNTNISRFKKKMVVKEWHCIGVGQNPFHKIEYLENIGADISGNAVETCSALLIFDSRL